MRFPHPDAEIAILGIGDIKTVFTIFAAYAIIIDHRPLRNAVTEFFALLKERTLWIVCNAILKRIPCFISPTRIAIDRIGIFGTVYGDDALAASVAGARIERALIAPCEFALPSAFRTLCGRRHGIFLFSDHWRNFFVKFEIGIGDLERCFAPAVGTSFLHG